MRCRDSSLPVVAQNDTLNFLHGMNVDAVVGMALYTGAIEA